MRMASSAMSCYVGGDQVCSLCSMWLLDRRATSILFGAHHSSYVALVSHGYLFPRYRVRCGLALVPLLLSVLCVLALTLCKAQLAQTQTSPSSGCGELSVCHILLHRAGR
jgi:hypothetical protein